jgi:hypothetical protein
MSKIIIENKCVWLKLSTAITCIDEVIKMGKISKGPYGEQYCHLTTFTFKAGKIGVSADKRNSGTHKFIVFEMHE